MTDDKLDIRAWADILIERWQRRMKRLKIYQTGALVRSFTSQVQVDAKGDPLKVLFVFLYYGRFSDMGVGNGVPLQQVPYSNRKAKPWFNKVFFRELNYLAREMAQDYGDKAAEMVRYIEQVVELQAS